MVQKIDLNKITDSEIEERFSSDRDRQMFYTVLKYSYRDIPNYELVTILTRLKFDVSVDNSKSSMGLIFVKDKTNTNLCYTFKY